MKAMKWWLPVLFCVLLLNGAAIADDNTWVLGSWVHSFDPDGDKTKDTLTFSADGKFISKEPVSGQQLEGVYFVRPGIIKLSFLQQGKILLKFDLTFDAKKDILYFTSQRTGNTAHYTRVR